MVEVNEKRVPWLDLKEFIRAFFLRNGLSGKDAEVSADSVASANLRGIDSHGVHLLPKGQELLGETVAEFIGKHLPAAGKGE